MEDYPFQIKSLHEIEKESLYLFTRKYETDHSTYDMKIVNDIVYNERTRLVAIFKDYLIFDDCSEFLRRFYTGKESNTRLSKIIGFYDTYSKIFPNYIIIPESKYLYKNIRRKQKMIYTCNKIKKEEDHKKKKIELNNLLVKRKESDNFFDTVIKKSILRYQPSISHLNLEASFTINKSQSLNGNIYAGKPVLENEESLIVIENLLDVMDRKKEETTQTNNKYGNDSSKDNKNLITINNEIKSRLKNIIYSENILKSKANKGHFLKVNKKVKTASIGSNNTNTTNTINENSIVNKFVYSNKQQKTNHVINESNPSASASARKKASHRFSSSIPEVVKIYNNYPNIIIPSGSTHVSINQNYYNCGPLSPFAVGSHLSSACHSPIGSRVIMIENYDAKPQKIIVRSDIKAKSVKVDLNNRCFGGDSKSNNQMNQVAPYSNNQLNTIKSSLNVNKISKKTNTLTAETNPKNTNMNNFVSNPNPSLTNKTKSSSKVNLNENLNFASQNTYIKVLKIFKDNYSINNSNSKSNLKSLKTLERKESNIKQNLKNETENLHSSVREDSKASLSSTKIKLKLDTKQAYKQFLEKNKLECLTTRNSLEKVCHYLNTENFKKVKEKEKDNFIFINSTATKIRIESNKQTNQFYMSPSPLIHSKDNQEILFKKKETTPFKVVDNVNNINNINNINNVDNVIRNKNVKLELNTKREDPMFNFKSNILGKDNNTANCRTNKKEENSKVVFNIPFEQNSALNKLKSPTFTGTKVNVRNLTVKSLDFQILKNLKK